MNRGAESLLIWMPLPLRKTLWVGQEPAAVQHRRRAGCQNPWELPASPGPGFMRLRHYHTAAGALALAAFVLSGQYMHWSLGHLRDMPDVPRLLYRSSHIYLLFAGLLNLALGLYLQMQAAPRARVVQAVGSVMLMASPVFFGWSFLAESQQPSIERQLLRLGIYLSFGGVVLHTVAAWLARSRLKTAARAVGGAA